MKSALFALVMATLIACSGSKQALKGSSTPTAARTAPDDNLGATGGSMSLSTPMASKDMFGAQEADKLLVVHFAFDSAELSEESQAALRQNAEYLRQHPMAKIVIEGHTDERGSAEYNLALGHRRAQAVRNYLALLGIDTSRMETVSYGSEQPVDPGHDEDAWAQNRRAQFRNL